MPSTPLSTTLGPLLQASREFAEKLQFASPEEYFVAVKQASQDVVVATRSLQNLSYLTFRPICILLYVIFGRLSVLAHFLFRQLFAGLWQSTVETFKHLKWISLKAYRWQFARTWRHVCYEIIAVAVVAALILLRRHIQQQAYVQRATKYVRRQRRKVTKTYRSILDRISRTSLWLAMILPHALFVGTLLFLRVLFPGPLRYLARDCNLVWLLSIAYPWCSSFGVVWKYRQEQAEKDVDFVLNPNPNSSRASSNTTARTPLAPKTPKKNGGNEKNTTAPAFFTKTTPRYAASTASSSSKRTPRENDDTDETDGHLEHNTNQSDDEATYWMHYWMVHAVFGAIIQLIHSIPFSSRITSSFGQMGLELQLLWYLWMYGLGSALTASAQSVGDTKRSYQVRPLPLLISKLKPLVVQIYTSISRNILPPSVWKYGTKKLETFLSIAVMVRFVSKEFSGRIIASLDGIHPMVIPALTLGMPGFVTQFGVLYIQTIIPTAKCCFSSGNEKKRIHMLHYWVLATLFSGILQWWSGILWWIPFSTHLIFILWCRLQFSFEATFQLLVCELQAFGLLPGSSSSTLEVHETYTASMLRILAKTLPSAAETNEVVSDEVEATAPLLEPDTAPKPDAASISPVKQQQEVVGDEPVVVVLEDVPAKAVRQRQAPKTGTSSTRRTTRSSAKEE